jgi:glycosyltransferase involved in cell wall biosynthesis
MIKFSVITPAYNAEKYIGETIRSIVQQTAFTSGRAELEYLLCDGGSTDATCSIAESILKNAKNCTWRIFSQPDSSMYAAIIQGMKQATGEVFAYLNAGDVLSPNAIEVLTDVFNNPKIRWVTGIKVVINDFSQIIRVRFPYRYRRSFIRKGYYGEFLPFIQQDACFWRKELNETLNYELLSDLKLAGDYYLWHRFSTVTDLFIVNTHISGFRIHPGQKSEDKRAYRREKLTFLNPNLFVLALDVPVILFDWLFLFADHIRNHVNRTTLIEFDIKQNKWLL